MNKRNHLISNNCSFLGIIFSIKFELANIGYNSIISFLIARQTDCFTSCSFENISLKSPLVKYIIKI